MMEDRYRFRAWLPELKKMVVPNVIRCVKRGIAIEYEDNGQRYLDGPGWFELMRCTGLRDKNGKLIWEGDVLLAPKDIIGVVKWCSDYDKRGYEQNCGFVFDTPGAFLRKDLLFWVLDEDPARVMVSGVGVEVIGNIWDTPNLLSAGDFADQPTIAPAT